MLDVGFVYGSMRLYTHTGIGKEDERSVCQCMCTSPISPLPEDEYGSLLKSFAKNKNF
jgi:hypothetical protein